MKIFREMIAFDFLCQHYKFKIMLKELFQSIDDKDTDKFLTFVIQDVLDRFFGSIDSISHEIVQIWKPESDILVQGIVSFTRLDKATLKIPFCNIFKMKNNLINEYLIYADTSSLYS